MGPQTDREKETAVPLHLVAEEEVRQSGLRLKFPENLERRYQRDTATARAHELRVISRIGLAVFLVIDLLMDLFLDQNLSWKVSLFYSGLLTVVMFLVQPCFRPTVPFFKREGAIFGFCATYCLAAIALASSQQHASLFEPFVFATLPISFILIFVRLPFPLASLLVAVAGSAYGASLLTHPGLSLPHKAFLFGFLLSLALPTLVAAHWLERASRRLYLHNLLQRLTYEHVVAQNAILTDVSYTDPLTGCANRRRMDGELQRLCDKDDTCATFLVADIDWFKNFNDRHGHPVGDRCLQEMATCLAAALRDGDLLARLGGEEFGVLLPRLPMDEAVLVAERLRAAVASYPFMVGTRIVRMTVSIGVASIVAYDEPARVFDAAEKAMYKAKRAGRNRVGGPWMKMAS